MSYYDDFYKCTHTVFDGDVWDISCKLGLWDVQCECKADAQGEAAYYFAQYKEDGEYSSIIGGKSVIEVEIERGNCK